MIRDGWTVISDVKEISLTDSGYRMAASVIRRHMLTEWMLSRVLKLPLSELHREAHHIEHTLSAEVEQRLLAEMDDPTVCPHGNPLPGYEGEVLDWMPLSEVGVGENVVLRRIHESIEDHYERLLYLDSVGLMPGAEMRVLEVMPFNETIKIRVKDRDVTLGLNLAANIFVSPLQT
jgi:DtxR family Mn-dependent transcriptional regulator